MFEPGAHPFPKASVAARALGRMLRLLCWGIAFAGAALGLAQAPRPLLGPGASKEEVLDAYGWPSGQSKLGAKEILSYPQGRVVLDDGRVEKIEFTMKPPWPPPRPRPAWAVPAAKTGAGLTEAQRAAREEPVQPAPEPGEAKAVPAVAQPPASSERSTISATSVALMSTLFKVEWVLIGAITLGVVIAAVLFWLVWRKWTPAPHSAPKIAMTTRISDAASGLPSQLDLATWPRARLVALVAAFVEAEGYHAEVQPAGGDMDIVLRRAGSDRPQALILCAGSEAGLVTLPQVREFFATLTAERVDTGWYVAPAGFAQEARNFAGEHKFVLLDGPELAGQLRELPPLVLPKVLAKAVG